MKRATNFTCSYSKRTGNIGNYDSRFRVVTFGTFRNDSAMNICVGSPSIILASYQNRTSHQKAVVCDGCVEERR
jgi:hypothetical protein